MAWGSQPEPHALLRPWGSEQRFWSLPASAFPEGWHVAVGAAVRLGVPVSADLVGGESYTLTATGAACLCFEVTGSA